MGATLSILIPVVILAYAVWLVVRTCGGRTRTGPACGGQIGHKRKRLSRLNECGCNPCGCPLAESCGLARALQKKDGDERT